MSVETRETKIKTFSDLLKAASENVAETYFKLPVSRKNDGIEESYRERVYCYELYHQMRCFWSRFHNPDDLTLAAEVDKRGHEHFIGTLLDSKIPDFLVHVAGSMRSNHAVIEVKTSKASGDKLSQDLIKLNDFMSMEIGSYKRGVLLIFGDSEGVGEKVAEALMKAKAKRENLKAIEVWIHDKVGSSARELW